MAKDLPEPTTMKSRLTPLVAFLPLAAKFWIHSPSFSLRPSARAIEPETT